MPLPLLAAIEPGNLDPSALAGGGSWWRMIGGLAFVFGLLFLCLKLLTRLGPNRGGSAQARVLAVWHLGPRREVQVLRLGDEVSYVYRHENSMVLLRQEPWEAYRREHGEPSVVPAGPLAAMPAALAARLAPLAGRLARPRT